MALDIQFTFDPRTYRHYMNGFASVLHCHHYITLTIKLAEQLDRIQGTKILMESMEDAIRPLLDDYYHKQNVSMKEERLAVAAEYFSVMGLGQMKYDPGAITKDSGKILLPKSHADQGWTMKFKKSDHPLNYPARGFIMAMFGATFNAPPRTYSVTEIKSIATGAEVGELLVKRGGVS